jgi:glycosyltransferase involved in cell wall biosynthesis
MMMTARFIRRTDTMKECRISQRYCVMPMSVPPAMILLVTPVWNDSARLAGFGRTLARALAGSSHPIRWIIADDGSDPSEELRLLELREEFAAVFPQVDVHFAGAHRGKGAVVREAWALAPEADWFSFLDADGSVTAVDFLNLIETAVSKQSSVLGIRKRTENTQLVESLFRGLAHRAYLALAGCLLGLRCEDTQCGAKIIIGDDYRHIAHRLCEDGLAFDTELLFALNHSGCTWLEIPVSWEEKPGSKIKPLRDGWKVFRSLLEIRNRPW